MRKNETKNGFDLTIERAAEHDLGKSMKSSGM